MPEYLTVDELRRFLPKISNDCLRKSARPLGAVGGKERKRDSNATLVRHKSRQPRREGRVAVLVTIITCRNRLCDSDNSGMGGNKALRDAIADSLGADDGSPAIGWQFGQCLTHGEQGTIVLIQRL